MSDRRDGIEIAIQIRDFGDRDEDDRPKVYQARHRLSEHTLAGSGTPDIVDISSEQAIYEAVSTWRSERETDD